MWRSMLYIPRVFHYSHSVTRARHTTTRRTTARRTTARPIIARPTTYNTNMMSWSVLLLGVLLMTAAAQDSVDQQKEEEEVLFVTAGPGPPQNVVATPVGANALNVSWTPPDEMPIVYVIHMFTDGHTHDTSYLITELTPCTSYEITVYSVYESEHYDTSVRGRTLCTGPGPPLNVVVTSEGANALYVSWDPPEEKPGYYTVDVLTEDINKEALDTSYLITGLKYCTGYIITVSSVYESEQYSTSTFGTTNCSGPWPPLNVVATPLVPDTLLVTWDPPDEKPLYYTIQIYYAASNEVVFDTVYIIEKLDNCTRYLITVSSVYDSGPKYSAGIFTKTLCQGPGPPLNTLVTTMGANALNISWDPPDEKPKLYMVEQIEITNGTYYIMTGLDACTTYTYNVYSVYDDHKKYNNAAYGRTLCTGPGPPQEVEATDVGPYALNVSWVAREEKPKYYVIRIIPEGITGATFDTSYLITGLNICTDYTITVSPVYGSDQYISYTFSNTDCPGHGPPVNVTVTSVGANTIDVSWDPPEVTPPEYFISIYPEQIVIYTMNTSLHLTGLTPCTEHVISVGCKYDGGPQYPYSVFATTDCTDPGPPVILEVTASVGSVVVSWTPPDEANGIIIEYMINAVSEEDSVSTSVAGTVLTSVVEDLQECQTYNITVRARTEAGWGPESEVWNITVSEMFDTKPDV